MGISAHLEYLSWGTQGSLENQLEQMDGSCHEEGLLEIHIY